MTSRRKGIRNSARALAAQTARAELHTAAAEGTQPLHSRSALRARRTRVRTRADALFALITSLVLVFSFALPHLVAMLQSSIIEAQTGRQTIREVVLTPGNSDESIVELLRFVSEGYRSVRLQGADNTTDSISDFSSSELAAAQELGNSLTAADALAAHEAATQALRTLSELGLSFLSPELYALHLEDPILAMTADAEGARLLWVCTFEGANQETVLTVLIDDASKNALSFSVYSSEADTIAPEEWAVLFATFYALENGEFISAHAGLPEDERIVSDGYLHFTDATGISVYCSFLQRPSLLSFNEPPFSPYIAASIPNEWEAEG